MIIHDDKDRNKFITKLLSVDLSKQPWEAVAKVYKKNRSASQNALYAVWLRDIGKQTEQGEEYERLTSKLNIGLPIMMQHKDFAEAWMPYKSQSYENQLKAMAIVDVTKLMNIEEMSVFLTEFENQMIENGFHLSKPGMYQEALNR